METLPDHLATGLDLVFVGLNPSTYSVQVGHYFANPRNRFWEAFKTIPSDRAAVKHALGDTDLLQLERRFRIHLARLLR